MEEKIQHSETQNSEAQAALKPDQLQEKLNEWVDQIEKQVKQMERKLTRKIKLIEESQSKFDQQQHLFLKRNQSSAMLEERAALATEICE